MTGNTKQRRYQRIQEHLGKSKDAEAPLLSEQVKKYDPKATTEDLIADLRSIQEANPEKFITRRLYRSLGKYSDSTWDSKFGTFAEFRKQAGLELSRGQQAHERQIAKHASADVYRGFYEVEVLPWIEQHQMAYRPGLKTILVGSDFHDLLLDPFAYGVFLDVARRTQPDVVVFNGDVFDEYEFSRFDKDPREIRLLERFTFVRDMIFRPMREACPNAQIDLILGNHEHRVLKHLAERTPYMRVVLSDLMGLTLADLFGLPAHQINLVSKWDLAAWNPRAVAGEVARNYKVYWNAFAVSHIRNPGLGLSGTSGHTHRPDFEVWTDHGGDKWWCVTGGLAQRRMEYTMDKDNAQQSFLLVTVDPETKECVPEHIYLQRNLARYCEKVYRRSEEAAGAA